MTILDVIIANKKKELAALSEMTTVADLEKAIFFQRDVWSEFN